MAAMLFTLFAGGCEASDRVPDIEDTVSVSEDNSAFTENGAAQSYGFAERLAGRYISDNPENGRTDLEVYWINGTLVAEAKQEYAAYFAAELIPKDSEILCNTTAEKAEFTVYAFSGFSNFGEYFDEIPLVTAALTDSGFAITEANGKTVVFTRDESAKPIHYAERLSEMLSQIADTTGYTNGITGSWTADIAGGYSIALELCGDGSLLLYSKKDGEPIEIYFGVGGIAKGTAGSPDILTVAAERVGYSEMPYIGEFEFELTGTGLLLLKNNEADGLLPTDDEVAFDKDNEKE